jgi:hypothetical protein
VVRNAELAKGLEDMTVPQTSVTLKNHDFAVTDGNGETLGTLRIKASHLWWRSTGGAKWRRIGFDRVIQLVEGEGAEVESKTG